MTGTPTGGEPQSTRGFSSVPGLRYPVHRLRSLASTVLARMTGKTCFGYETMKPHLQGQAGIEFGGPSAIFSAHHLVPLYDVVGAIDDCNFARHNPWSSNRDARRFGSRLGEQFLGEASDVAMIADGSYAFVAASHVLEHVANPLQALQEWRRILRPGGTILLVLPHKAGTFDHRRPFTTFQHLRADFEAHASEADLTHLPEILTLHDLALDPPAGSWEQFRARCLQNASLRAMHHHVFSPELVVEMFNFFSMSVLNLAVERPHHLIVHAQKTGENRCADVSARNAEFLRPDAAWRRRDPFGNPHALQNS